MRGSVVKIQPEGALAHANKLAQRYTSKQHFYSDIYPIEQRQRGTRVIVKIKPIKVSVDAIFREERW
jgi:hypothetical protein